MMEISLLPSKPQDNAQDRSLREGKDILSTGNPLLNDPGNTETTRSPTDIDSAKMQNLYVIKPTIFDHDEEIDLGKVLNFAHAIFFGSGRHFYVTLSSAALVIIIALFFVQKGVKNTEYATLIPIFIALVIEEIVNITFGYKFLKYRGFDQVLLATKNVHLREKWITYLRRGFYVALLLSITNLSRQVFVPSEGDTDDAFGVSPSSGALHGFIFFLINIVQFYVFSLNYYLLAVWCWVCWAQNDYFNAEIAPLFTEENVGDGSAQSKHFEFLEGISYHSNRWAVNHIVRTITGVVITMGNMALLYHNLEMKQYALVAQHATFIFTYYLSVWGTFITAGYANDSIARGSRQRLADMLIHAKDKAVRAEASYFLHALESTNRGFKVGGVTMHVEKAMTAGSLLFTAVVAVVKVHTF
jgi:hypothetical protein